MNEQRFELLNDNNQSTQDKIEFAYEHQQIEHLIDMKLEKHIQDINNLITKNIQTVISAQHHLTNENGNSSIKDSGNSIGNITFIDNTSIVHLMILFLQYANVNTTDKPLYLEQMIKKLEEIIDDNRKQYTALAESFNKHKVRPNE